MESCRALVIGLTDKLIIEGIYHGESLGICQDIGGSDSSEDGIPVWQIHLDVSVLIEPPGNGRRKLDRMTACIFVSVYLRTDIHRQILILLHEPLQLVKVIGAAVHT